MPNNDEQDLERKNRLSLEDIVNKSKQEKAKGLTKDQISASFWHSSLHTNNMAKIIIIGMMALSVGSGLLVSGYKYLNIGIHCRKAQSGLKITGEPPRPVARPETAETNFINCPYDKESQKEAGALLQSIVSGVIGIVAGMSLGSRP